MKALFLALWGSIVFLAPLVSLAHSPEDHFAHLPSGGRKALHGMVLFGAGPYFLEHIPMLSPPHDFQIIAAVSLTDKNGKSVTHDFSKQGFTLKPDASFSLNDYAAGKLKKFSASIYQGSFEQDGELIEKLKGVVVEVSEFKVIRQLPSPSNVKQFIFSDGKNSFESNVIRPDQNIQLIRNTGTGQVLWCVEGPEFFKPCSKL